MVFSLALHDSARSNSRPMLFLLQFYSLMINNFLYMDLPMHYIIKCYNTNLTMLTDWEYLLKWWISWAYFMRQFPILTYTHSFSIRFINYQTLLKLVKFLISSHTNGNFWACLPLKVLLIRLAIYRSHRINYPIVSNGPTKRGYDPLVCCNPSY